MKAIITLAKLYLQNNCIKPQSWITLQMLNQSSMDKCKWWILISYNFKFLVLDSLTFYPFPKMLYCNLKYRLMWTLQSVLFVYSCWDTPGFCIFGISPFITVIKVYALTSNAEEAEVEKFYEDLQDLRELTPKKDVLFITGDRNAKVGSQETLEEKANLALENGMKQGKD